MSLRPTQLSLSRSSNSLGPLGSRACSVLTGHRARPVQIINPSPAYPIWVFGPAWSVRASGLPDLYGSSSTVRPIVGSTQLVRVVKMTQLVQVIGPTRPIKVIGPTHSIQVVGHDPSELSGLPIPIHLSLQTRLARSGNRACLARSGLKAHLARSSHQVCLAYFSHRVRLAHSGLWAHLARSSHLDHLTFLGHWARPTCLVCWARLAHSCL